MSSSRLSARVPFLIYWTTATKQLRSAVILVLALWVISSAAVEAQEGVVTVSNPTGQPLLVNGEEVVRLPILTTPGAQVCVLVPQVYLNEKQRKNFRAWSHGPEDECVTLDAPGQFSPQFTDEVLLQVRSWVKAYRTSVWVPRGSRVPLTVLEVVVEEPGVRFLFDEWTGGESPFSTENVIVPSRPLVLEVKWTKEFFLKLEGPEGIRLVGSGWHKDRAQVVLQAPATAFSEGDKERLQFEKWETVSNPALVIPNHKFPTTRITIDDAHAIRAFYEKAFLIDVQNPLGTVGKDWLPSGEELTIDTPEVIEVIPKQERLSFVSWDGADVDAPRGFIVVERPLRIAAIYETQYQVTVASTYGSSGGGWYVEGETATIEVPDNPSTLLFLKKVFNGFTGYPNTGPTLEVTVDGAISIPVSYKTEVDRQLLATIIAAVVVTGAIYLISQIVYNRRRDSS